MAKRQKHLADIEKRAKPKQIHWMQAHTGNVEDVFAIAKPPSGTKHRSIVIRIETDGNRTVYLCGFCSRGTEKEIERPQLHTKKGGEFTHTCPICGCSFVVEKGVASQTVTLEPEDLLVTSV